MAAVLSAGSILAYIAMGLISGGATVLGEEWMKEGLRINDKFTLEDLQKLQGTDGMHVELETNKQIKNAYDEWKESEEGKQFIESLNNGTSKYHESYNKNLEAEKKAIESFKESGIYQEEPTQEPEQPEEEQAEEEQKPTFNLDPSKGSGVIMGEEIQNNADNITNEVQDKTDENLGTNTINWLQWWEEKQKESWDRYDKLRAEEYARQDSAYQRAAADARKAGINLNLMNISPAASNTTVAAPSTPTGATMDAELLMNELNNLLKEDEGTKDRIAEIFTQFMQIVGFIMAMKGKGGK